MKSTKTNWDELAQNAIENIKEGKNLSGSDGALIPLIKKVIDTALEQELTNHIKNGGGKNRRNGRTKKTVKSVYGNIEIEGGRDRNGTHQPKIIKKRQLTIGNGLAEKIISLYAKGMSYSDMRDHIKDLYGLEVSEAQISHITDGIIKEVREWQSRPLKKVYITVWMDAIHFKVRTDGRVVSKAVYCLIGLNQEGLREVLGMYLGESESAAFWLKCLTELKNRGVQDILIACIDNLKGFKEAIHTVFPKTEIQQCVIHQIRNSMKYISYKDNKAFLADLKSVYKAETEDLATHNLEGFSEKWGKKYPHVVKSWENNWPELSAYFKYPPEIRTIIYTTNMIESFHSQIRKITKTKRIFPTDMALMKLLYLVQEDITKKWVRPIRNWGQILSQFAIIFGDRLQLDLKL